MWQGCKEKGAPPPAPLCPMYYWWGCKLAQPPWKSVEILHKIKIAQPHDPGILLLGINTKERKSESQRSASTSMFTQGLFIIQDMETTHMSINGWMGKKKMFHVCVCLSIYSPGRGIMQGQGIPGGCPEACETPGGRCTWGHKRVRHDLVTKQQIYIQYIYTVEYYSTRNSAIHNNMDETREYCAKWNK